MGQSQKCVAVAYSLKLKCKKPRQFWIQTHILIQKFLKINIQLKVEAFLLGVMDKHLEKVREPCFKISQLQQDCYMHKVDRFDITYKKGMAGEADGI